MTSKKHHPYRIATPLRPRSARISAVALLLAGLCCCGCASLQVAKYMPEIPFISDENEPAVPERMTALWTTTVLEQEGKKSIRGFGGRVMFYARKADKPVNVDGTLTVFAFDDTDPNTSITRADRKYVFPAEQLASHHSKSMLGDSYSFWLPWDEVGGPTLNIRLIARFEPKGGASVMSEEATQTLPGIPNDAALKQAASLAHGARRPATHSHDPNAAGTRAATQLPKHFHPPAHAKELGQAGGDDGSGVDLAAYEVALEEERHTGIGEAVDNGLDAADHDRTPSISATTIDVPSSFAQRYFVDVGSDDAAESVASEHVGHDPRNLTLGRDTSARQPTSDELPLAHAARSGRAYSEVNRLESLGPEAPATKATE